MPPQPSSGAPRARKEADPVAIQHERCLATRYGETATMSSPYAASPPI